MEPDDPTRTCVPYERLDYMHVPTYAPLFCLLLRAEMLLIIFEIGKHFLPSIQSLMAVMVVMVYADMYIFKKMQQMKAFQNYVGGIMPVLLALLTNSNTLRLSDESTRWLSVSWMHLCVDIAWIVTCLFLIIVSVKCTHHSWVCQMSLSLTTLLGLSHVVVLDGQHSTPVAEFALRILLFYSCALILYAVYGFNGFKQNVFRDASDTQIQALATLHASLPVLWVHILVLHVYVIICLSLVIHLAWCASDKSLINVTTLDVEQKSLDRVATYDIFDTGVNEVNDLNKQSHEVNTAANIDLSSKSSHNILVNSSNESDILLQQLRDAQAAQKRL